jgi:hypothetical protein
MKSSVPQLVKKIAPKTLTDGKLTAVVAMRDLYDVFGVASKIKTRNTVNATWIEFVGDFEARTTSGEVYRSRRCQVPPPFEDELFSRLIEAQAKDSKASVEFAVRISVVPPPKGKPSAVGYEYQVTRLVESRVSNPIAVLRETLSQRAVGGVKR